MGCLWLLYRRHWRSAFWLGLPTLLLFLLGSTPLPEYLADPEESRWVAGDGQSSAMFYDAVVALGGGERVSAHDPLGFAMCNGGSRVLTAIQLFRSGQAKNLVLGGCLPVPGKPAVPSLGVVQDWVVSWGLPPGSVTNLGVCINTHDEAVAFGRLARNRGWSKVMLVTSALHMRRAVAVFQKQGIGVIPVAADFQVSGVCGGLHFSLFPRSGRLDLLSLYLHEKIGWRVYKWRGWI